MPDPVSFELVSPERLLMSEDVEMVVVPGSEGDFGVLWGHAAMISSLRPGVIGTWSNGALEKRIFVAGGFAEVTAERCTVLAEEAMPVEDIDRASAEARIRAAHEAIGDAASQSEKAQAEAELAVAEAMLAAAGSA